MFGIDAKSRVVLEAAVFDDRIRIRVTESAVQHAGAVVPESTIVHDQVRSSRDLIDACRGKAGDDRVLDHQSAAPGKCDSIRVAEHDAVHR